MQKILNNKTKAEGSKNNASENKESESEQGVHGKKPLLAPKESVEVKVDAVSKTKPSVPPEAEAGVRDSTSSLGSEVSVETSEDDLRALRRRSRPSIDPRGLRYSRESAISTAAYAGTRDRVISDVKADDHSKNATAATRGEGIAARRLNRRASMGVGESMNKLSFKEANSGPSSGPPIPRI